jgi:hypothetical protein
MSNSVQAVQSLNALIQAQAAAPTHKNVATAPQNTAPEDKVTISDAAKQALAGKGTTITNTAVNPGGK